jgi:predicted nucleic acid-binding protein
MEKQKQVEQLRVSRPDFAQKFDATLAELVSTFSQRILALDTAASLEWGRMLATRDKHRLDTAVAAIAKSRKFTVVTRNTGDYAGRGVRLLDPFKNPPKIIEAA